jgi:hypothetical protein
MKERIFWNSLFYTGAGEKKAKESGFVVNDEYLEKASTGT